MTGTETNALVHAETGTQSVATTQHVGISTTPLRKEVSLSSATIIEHFRSFSSETLETWRQQLHSKNQPVRPFDPFPLVPYPVQYARQAMIQAARMDALTRTGIVTLADFYEHCFDQYADYPCLADIETWHWMTFKQVEEKSNQIANGLMTLNIEKKWVGVIMENNVFMVCVLIALSKLGICTALIPNHWKSQLETILKNISNGIILTCNKNQILTYDSVHLMEMDFTVFSKSRPRRLLGKDISATDAAYLIFTEELKTMPITHRDMIEAACTWRDPCLLDQTSVYYISLDFHRCDTLLVALAPALISGTRIVLSKSFSAPDLLTQIRKASITHLLYDEALWRSVHQIPASVDDVDTTLRVCVGSGLRDIFDLVRRRFGLVRVVEYYMAKNASHFTLLNWFNRSGACGFLPNVALPLTPILVKYNWNENRLERDQVTEFCQSDNKGMLLLPLNEELSNDNQNIVKNVLALNDSFWMSGDLMKRDADGWFFKEKK